MGNKNDKFSNKEIWEFIKLLIAEFPEKSAYLAFNDFMCVFFVQIWNQHIEPAKLRQLMEEKLKGV